MACKKVTTITDATESKEHIGIQVPVDPWKFGKDIQYSQPRGLDGQLNILFNKGRYYEISIWDSRLVHQISWIMSKKKFHGCNIFCGTWQELETFVSVANSLGYYCNINIDWI